MPPLGPEPQGAVLLRVVVSDSGPLICLGRLDLLRLLPALFAEVQVPEPVLRECAVGFRQLPSTIQVLADAAPISRRPVLPIQRATECRLDLGLAVLQDLEDCLVPLVAVLAQPDVALNAGAILCQEDIQATDGPLKGCSPRAWG